jgi:hypothetical protein
MRCAADPGPILRLHFPWVPALRCIVKNAAPRPGHGCNCLTNSLQRSGNPAARYARPIHSDAAMKIGRAFGTAGRCRRILIALPSGPRSSARCGSNSNAANRSTCRQSPGRCAGFRRFFAAARVKVRKKSELSPGPGQDSGAPPWQAAGGNSMPKRLWGRRPVRSAMGE